jgi:hypothetical protein
MHFHEFYSDNILYMFRVGKLFIFRRQFYCKWSLWYVSFILVDLTATTIEMEVGRTWRSSSMVVAAGPNQCMIHTINCMYSKISSWRWIACLFETCRGCYQNKIQESAPRWFYYKIYQISKLIFWVTEFSKHICTAWCAECLNTCPPLKKSFRRPNKTKSDW